MSDQDNQDKARAAGERIASLMRSIEGGPRKEITGEELQKLKIAGGRLDQMLKDIADADRQALRDATAKLDQLLADIRAGRDVADRLNRRRDNGE